MDSDWVPVAAETSDFHIAVAENGFFCYDTAFEIYGERLRYGSYRARRALWPFGPAPQKPTTWGSLKALYGNGN
jgi:hypothetical protein